MEAVAGQTARLVNVSDLAAPFALTRPTIDAYLTLLRHVFLVDEPPAWHRNRLKRLVKAAKLHNGDSGIGAALRRSGRDEDLRFVHHRERDGCEVDVVLDRDIAEVAGVEVKGAATVTEGDAAGSKRLARAAGPDLVGGVVLHDGDAVLPFGDRLFAVPIPTLW